MRLRMLSGWSLGAIALGFLLPATAAGQYFGRQKVQYEDFDWRVFNTQHFEVHFYPAEQQVTNDAGRMAERWYTRLSRAFQHEFKQKPLIFYADHPDFQQTNVIGGMLTEGTGGVTEGLRNRVIMPYTGVYRDNDHVLGHELVHVFQYDLASSPGGGGLAGMGRLPLWLVEGMAEYLSLGRNDPHTAMWLRDAALRGELPTIDQLTRDPRFFPYRYGQALWAYIAGRWGDRAVTELYRFSTRAGWEAALQRVLGTNNQRLSQDWIASIRSTYLPVIAGRQRPEDAGDRVLFSNDIGAMHLSPVVSPDGRYVAYFARHDLFSIDLYVADAVTGKVVKKLTNPNRTPHFDALSFISSAGTWSPDGQKFAFPVFDNGDMRLTIYDVESEKTERDIEIQEVGAIQNPAWSPDGSRIAFSGMKGGVSDLYILDLTSGVARQMTNDRYADLQPTWSPDGRTIAFATDRGPRTNFETLTFGEMHIALLDMGTNAVRTLDIFQGAKHINPQFSPDGRDLYFIADRDGFSDIYRIPVAGGEPHQITRLATGASGITALSPAMSVAQRSGRMLFSVFENSGYNVYGVDAERTRGTPVQPAAVASVAGILPPTEALGEGMVADYLADAMTGLPAQQTFAAKEYSPKLRLDYLGQPSFGVGLGGYTGGVNVGGGISAYFSDMMGDHNLITVLQANGTLKDIGGQAVYQNMENRINWAGLIGHIPYLTPYRLQSIDMYNGQQVYRIDEVLERVFVDQAIGFAHYPFSQTRRIEFNAGFTRYSFDREINTYFIAPSGDIIDERRGEEDAGDPINMMQVGAALVGDNSHFGFVSPLSGQRYRLEVSPTFGTITYQNVVADYRRYFFMRPTSLAFRALHIGRYGADGEDPRLSPLFLGYETLVRGYDQNSFAIDECTLSENNNTCPEFDRLVGSRLAVANFEWRIPLIGTEELGLINLPIIPVEIAPFFDAGMAWTRDESPTFDFARVSGDRVPVFSAGITSRFNLLGYLILEMYYAYPFQRPGKGWHLGFNIAPGW